MKDVAEEEMRLCRRTVRKAYGFPATTILFSGGYASRASRQSLDAIRF